MTATPAEPYNDEYPTCGRTFATLRVYHTDLDPDWVTQLLGMEPTRTQRKGQPFMKGVLRTGAWFVRTEGVLASKDVCRHIDWLLDRLAGKTEALREAGCRIDIFCYWLSAQGHGGPTLYPATLKQLGELGIEVGFDVYLGGD